MGSIRQKLNSKRGASLILAAAFFLLCAAVGGVVLTSAMANAGRLSHLEQEQQAYLTVSSAARLLREELEGRVFETKRTVIERSPGGLVSDEMEPPSLSPAGGSMDGILKEDGEAVYRHENYGGVLPAQRSFSIDAGDSRFAQVNVTKFQMKQDYQITAVLTLKNDDRYSMTLTLPAVCSESGPSSSSKDVYTTDPDTGDEILDYTETTAETTTTVTWKGGVITKGGG